MKEKLKRIFLSERAKDIYKRAAKTFLQAFLGAIVIDTATLNADASVWRSMFLGAVAAGISATMNAFIVAIQD